MARTKRSFELTAIGLAIVNVVTIAVVVGCLLRAERAIAIDGGDPTTGEPYPAPLSREAQASIGSPARDLGVQSAHLMLVLGVVGIVGSTFVTWLLLIQVRQMAALPFAAAPSRARPPRPLRRPRP